MITTLKLANPAEIDTECLVVVVLDAGDASDKAAGDKAAADKNEARPELQTASDAVRRAADELIATHEISGKMFETVMVHRPHGLKARRLLLVGGGKAKTFSPYDLRRVAGTAVRFLKSKSIRKATMVAPTWAASNGVERGGAADALKSIAEGAYAADFDPDTYKSDRKDMRMEEVAIAVEGQQDAAALQRALDQGRIVGESQNFTRELVNEPGNRMTPTELARRARAMVEEMTPSTPGLSVEVLGGEKIRELKMGAFWSVSQGSDEPPALIVIRYDPPGAPAKPVIGLVGKGITFDSGGISIKPSDGMEKMKYDMAGGAAMLGAMRALAALKPKVRILCVVCASENMPSGKAQKPGDVQIAMSGKSIEIINTDAEGRLVLADGLHYARQLGATHLVDAATLTGAVVVALGYVNAGVFANDEELYQRFSGALGRAGEKMWRMPLDEEYREMIRSGIADIVNSGGRWGGAISAAMFLKEFVSDTPWLHLDIAGTAWLEENKPWMAKGPSGIAVRSLVEFVRSFEG